MERTPGTFARVAAGCIALAAWTGLIIQCAAVYRQYGSVSLMLWIVFAYFTITTNLLVAAVFTAIAMAKTSLRKGWVVGGTVLSIVLVGVVYGLLLHGTAELSGGSAIANVLLHMVTPVLVLAYWIFLAPKGTLDYMHAMLWAIYPLAYVTYALLRARSTGQYAYPFLNAPLFGWGQVVINTLVIALGFIMASLATVWIDHRLQARNVSHQ